MLEVATICFQTGLELLKKCRIRQRVGHSVQSVPKQQAVWHTEEMNILLAMQKRTNMKNLLHIYILNIVFQMWLHATQYYDIVSRNCCVYSFICKIIGWLFIVRGCDTKIIWMKRYLKIVFTFASHFLWSNVKTVHIVTKQCS